MIIRVVNPSVHMLTSIHDARKALALCAYHAGISRGRAYDRYVVGDSENQNRVMVGAPQALAVRFEGQTREFAQAERLVGKLLLKEPRPHESIVEHGVVSFLFEGSRIYTHEQVRHKIGLALTQMSTRFIEEKGVVRLIKPPHMPKSHLGDYTIVANTTSGLGRPSMDGQQLVRNDDNDVMAPDWVVQAYSDFAFYRKQRDAGVKRESARYNLPHCLASCIGITGNFRAIRHMIQERTAEPAAPEIKQLFFSIKDYMARISPVLIAGL